MPPLSCEALHNRLAPSASFTGTPPGYAPDFVPLEGAALVGRTSLDDADVFFAAGPGDAPRVRAIDVYTGDTLFDVFAFDPAFRGGCECTVVNGKVIATPAGGGGPVFSVIDPATGAVESRFLSGISPDYRGGLKPFTSDVDGDGSEDMVVMPKAGGAPLVEAVDVDTGLVKTAFFVGPQDDRSGGYAPAEAGIGPHLAVKGGELGFYVEGPDGATHAWTWGGVRVD